MHFLDKSGERSFEMQSMINLDATDEIYFQLAYVIS